MEGATLEHIDEALDDVLRIDSDGLGERVNSLRRSDELRMLFMPLIRPFADWFKRDVVVDGVFVSNLGRGSVNFTSNGCVEAVEVSQSVTPTTVVCGCWVFI